MFIEPRLSFAAKGNGRQKRRYPDIVICNTRSVIAVVELKYLPRAMPDVRKDINALNTIAKHRDELIVENARFRGAKRDARKYPFAKSVLFVWAGVHRPPSLSYHSHEVPLLSADYPDLDGCFMELHAETDDRKPPHIFARPV